MKNASCGKRSNGVDLLVISATILLLELACIRFFPAHVLFLTFFTNTILLASFLGMSVGCFCAEHQRNFLRTTPFCLISGIVFAYAMELLVVRAGYGLIQVGNSNSPDMVFFGTESASPDLAAFRIPAEVVNAVFFLVVALVFIGPGQVLGRKLKAVPNRIHAYSLNIFGSVVGIVLFSVLSALCLSPFWWFLLVALLLFRFLGVGAGKNIRGHAVQAACALIPLFAALPTIADNVDGPEHQRFWSPYYRIDYQRFGSHQAISVNMIGHQGMIGNSSELGLAYELPHLLNRDAGGTPFRDVLIIGAGSGNDVSRALRWGADKIAAVEIDPVIYRLGAELHPDNPYADSRVTVCLGDGRNFLRSTEARFDLIVFALVDSLVLHSSHSNVRLESFLFTREAFDDVKRCLKPNGTFVMYNYFRQGWIVARLRDSLQKTFGNRVLVFALPYQQDIEWVSLHGSFTMFMAGADHVRQAFADGSIYVTPDITSITHPSTNAASGFVPASTVLQGSEEGNRPENIVGPARIRVPDGRKYEATDEWPFLYLRRPMIPALTMRAIILMGVVVAGLLFLLSNRGGERSNSRAANVRMFCLGAGFMLIETKAVVQMAVLFGSTWVVNSVVFFGILVMILLANLWVLTARPERLFPYYVGLAIALCVNVAVPLNFFLGFGQVPQVLLAGGLVVLPVFFAGVIFAREFDRTRSPNQAFGFNVAGAMVGGFAENTSMLLGFQNLMLVAMVFYGVSAVCSGPVASREESEE